MSGKVVLVGAGPSNIDLLTIGGKREILSADVVVYDRLVSREILDLIPSGAEKIDVGKNAGNHPVKQEKINEILLEKAQDGKKVIRLKGGDCFLFGRGGEEIEYLKSHGISYEVISGVSSSISVPAYAGIPVTHRDFCSSLHIITGHKKGDLPLEIDYNSLVKLQGTLIFMMSVASANEIMQGLLNAKIDPYMPVAVIENGTTAKQKKMVTTVVDFEKNTEKLKSPSIIMVGKVCQLDFDFFSKKPLFGKKILVTRPLKSANKMAEALRENGAEVLVASTIEIQEIEFEVPDISNYDRIIFTSVNGVQAFFDKIYTKNIDARAFFGKKIATIGKITQKELLKYGILSDFVPSVFDSEVFAKEMIESEFLTKENNILLVCGNLSDENLKNQLKNFKTDQIICYKTEYIASKECNLEEYEIVTFTSASCVTSFVKNYSNYSHLLAFCIGEKTEKEALKYGFSTKISKNATIDSLTERIKEYYND